MGKKELAMKEFRISELRALENNDEDKMIIEGYAAVFETETDLGWCKEIISRDAFNNCNMSDCVLKYNHNDSCFILLLSGYFGRLEKTGKLRQSGELRD